MGNNVDRDKKSEQYKIVNFCQIQLAIVRDKENSLRKELLDLKIQKEFLTQTITSLGAGNEDDS